MNLEDFIVETMRQIVVGINKSRDVISKINRENDRAEQLLFQAANLDKEHGNHDVDFDVALTVVEDAISPELFIVGLKQLVTFASRVKFSVPLCYIQAAVKNRQIGSK